MAEWRTTTLGELGALYDGPHATPERRDSGPYFLNIASLCAGRLDLTLSDHVSADDFATWTRRVTPQAGDLLFSYETRLGEAATMPAGVDACLGRRMALIRPDRGRVDPRFLLYLYLSPAMQKTIEQHTIHGATVNRISLSTMGSWLLTLPGLPDQRAIAEVLGALDDKIAANTRLATTAEALASAIYASMLGGTQTLPLTALAEFVNGRAFTKEASGTGRVVVRIAELNSGLGGSTVYSDADVADQYLARPGDILFAWSGSLTLHRWYRDEAIINQHIFKVIPRSGWPTWLVWHALADRLDHFKGIAADKATTMGHIQRHHLDEPVEVPAPELVERHDATMTALWLHGLATEQENLTLAATRDALLPALMSGALRVRDAELLVEHLT